VVDVGAGTERNMTGLKSGKVESAESGVTLAVVVVQPGYESREGVIIGKGSMLMDSGTEATDPLMIAVSKVLGHGRVGEGKRGLAGPSGVEGTEGAAGGIGQGRGGIRKRLLGSTLVHHVSLDNIGHGTIGAELGRRKYKDEERVGISLDDFSIVIMGLTGGIGFA
jgi:hypothetical protein